MSAVQESKDALAASWEDLRRTAMQVKAERDAFEAALMLIAAMGGMTLLGGSELEPNRAHELGANKAFEQAADIARVALAKVQS